MQPYAIDESHLSPDTREFYAHVLNALRDSSLPFLIGGAYAFGCYTGIIRDTKDIDVFVLESDSVRVLDALAHARYRTELTDKVWLGKAFHEEDLVDVIFGSANGIAMVDEEWFAYARPARFLDLSLRLIPPEEMIWSKSFVMTRDRYDGADIAHVLHGHAERLDWRRLLRRFSDNWEVLLNHLVMFRYVYPSRRGHVPRWVMGELLGRLERQIEEPSSPDPVCRGTLLSETQYRIDIDQWGYQDARASRCRK